MSNKNLDDRRRRPYTLKARARRRDEVHRRITLAAVHLHGTVGPARTTMRDIAKHAGVRRATVYNHFPTELDLIDACSSHWFGQNPPPDPTVWAKIAEPGLRVEVALGEMYGYYDRSQDMLEKVLRDTPQVPALGKVLQLKWWPMLEGMVDSLAEGWSSPETRASLRVALDFFTWQTLTNSGLSNEQAARLVKGWIEAGRAAR